VVTVHETFPPDVRVRRNRGGKRGKQNTSNQMPYGHGIRPEKRTVSTTVAERHSIECKNSSALGDSKVPCGETEAMVSEYRIKKK
jgi:hypothetical protein